MPSWEIFDQLLALPVGADVCLLWPAGRSAQGYGVMRRHAGGKQERVHVRALEVTVGPRPSPLHEAAHSCRNRHCFNPAHLRWATRSENSLDRHRDGTCTQARLSPSNVREIRRLADGRLLRQAEIAERFGDSVSTIEYIKARKIWAHLPEEEGSTWPTTR